MIRTLLMFVVVLVPVFMGRRIHIAMGRKWHKTVGLWFMVLGVYFLAMGILWFVRMRITSGDMANLAVYTSTEKVSVTLSSGSSSGFQMPQLTEAYTTCGMIVIAGAMVAVLGYFLMRKQFSLRELIICVFAIGGTTAYISSFKPPQRFSTLSITADFLQPLPKEAVGRIKTKMRLNSIIAVLPPEIITELHLDARNGSLSDEILPNPKNPNELEFKIRITEPGPVIKAENFQYVIRDFFLSACFDEALKLPQDIYATNKIQPYKPGYNSINWPPWSKSKDQTIKDWLSAPAK